VLDLDEFVYAMSSSEKIRTKDLTLLFDDNRKTGVLERIFLDTTHGLRNAHDRLTSRTLKHIHSADSKLYPELAELDDGCVSIFQHASKRRSSSAPPEDDNIVNV